MKLAMTIPEATLSAGPSVLASCSVVMIVMDNSKKHSLILAKASLYGWQKVCAVKTKLERTMKTTWKITCHQIKGENRINSKD